jgi:xylan 1,4-beta-xylosidase
MVKYINPVITGFYPDPSVCRVGEDFYLVTSTFEYFPGVPVFHSKNLVNWTQVGHCLTRKSQLNLDGISSSGGIYAPVIRYNNGRFYMVTTDTTGIGNFYVYADDPAGEWSEPIRVDQGGIDPSLFFDDDGKVYFTSNSLFQESKIGQYQCEIDIETGEKLIESRFLWEGHGGKYPEAPHIYKRNGWYYLMTAEGGTEYGHMETIARSKCIWGPFEPCPYNPILSHRSLNSPIQSTGHAEMFEDQHGKWWMVFLAVRPVGYPPMHHLGRETFLTPLEWVDDWPVINDGKAVKIVMEVDALPAEVNDVPKITQFDDFDKAELGMVWNFRRNLDSEAWSISESCLNLKCLPGSLSAKEQLAFLGRRHQNFDSCTECLMSFSPENESEEAGLTVIMNEEYHTDLVLTKRNARTCIVLRRNIGSLITEIVEVECDSLSVYMKIETDPEFYFFYFRTSEDEEWITLGKAETRHHSTEIAGGFTGTYIGMYATANGTESENNARFDWFRYEDIRNRKLLF